MGLLRATAVFVALVILLAGCGGSGRSQEEILKDLAQQYQRLNEFLKLVRSENEAKGAISMQINTAANRIIDLSEALESAPEPPAEEREMVAGLRREVDQKREACRKEVQRVLELRGASEALSSLTHLPD